MRNTPFLRWWLSLVLILLGTGAAAYFGLLGKIYDADATKLSFLMYGLFAVYTILTGVNTKQACKEGADLDALCRKNEAGNFVSSLIMGLGLIGTVIGFILMSDVSFTDLKMDNISSMKDALANMGAGISTALYTTAVGQICGWGLRLQLFNLNQHLNKLRASCGCNTCVASKEAEESIGEDEDV